MAIAKFWDTVNEFSASEAAYLILGFEPEVKSREPLASHRRLLREMQKSFLDTCAHTRYCLERDLDPDETYSYRWQYDEDEQIVALSSIELSGLLLQCQSARADKDLARYRYHALFWLESAIDRFDSQRFARDSLGAWLYWREIQSEYGFESVEVMTPEKRREQVREVVRKCGGNKSEAARRLGISRTRVDQLIADFKALRHPLHGQAQDPFGIAPLNRPGFRGGRLV